MSEFIEIQAKDLSENTFKLIGTDWMLVTAGTEDKVNTMTASWGGLGFLWRKNVAYIVIRPQRYTKEFIDNTDFLSLSFLDDSFRKTLNYLGTVSGRDEDKITNSKLTINNSEDAPFFDEARLVLICKKLYKQDMDAKCFLDNDIVSTWYPDNSFHTQYILEITKVLTK